MPESTPRPDPAAPPADPGRLLRDDDPASIEWLGRRRRLFFITGHERSGTTWVGEVLMRHPRVFCDGEFQFHWLRGGFDAMARQPHLRASREPVRSIAEACFRDTVRMCMASCVAQKPGADWVGDRTPRRLTVLLPGTPHLVVVRDGRDVTVSVALMLMNGGYGAFERCRSEPDLVRTRERFLADPEHFKKHPDRLLACEPFVRQIARRWGEVVTHDRRVMARIEAGEIEASATEVRYEALHADPERERARMYRFLGLDPAEAAPLSADSLTTPGLGRDDHRSDKRKGAVGDWETYFGRDARAWFKAEAGRALAEAGYASDDRW